MKIKGVDYTKEQWRGATKTMGVLSEFFKARGINADKLLHEFMDYMAERPTTTYKKIDVERMEQ